MGKYRKLLAFVIGSGALLTMRHLEIDIPGIGALWMEMFVAALTGFGVYQAKNDPMGGPNA